MTQGLRVQNLTKYYGDYKALDDVSFAIEGGQFVTLLGPSGCGKTTLLRVIAGFLECDQGEVYFGDKLINDVPPNKRDAAMCFQSYALFPNKNVYENIRFGLRMRKVPPEEHKERVEEAMAMVNLTGLGERRPYELSGGQQQRVALARCIVVRPQLLLFDEPLSNLDAKLREKVRVEIREVQKKLGITAIYVTHDQAEALAISDQVITMSAGRIIQNAPPRDIYDRPNSRFVADFVGTANIVPCRILERTGTEYLVQSPYGELRAVDADCDLPAGAEGYLCIRPEDLLPSGKGESSNQICGAVRTVVYMGNLLDMFVDIGTEQIRASIAKDWNVTEGEAICFCVAPDKVRILGG